MSQIVTCLWFPGRDALAAAQFYAATFPDSRVGRTQFAPSDYPGGQEGDALTVDFTVLGQAFIGLNANPGITPNQSVSFQVLTDNQADTDRYWNAIIGQGGSESQCGWCRDRWGFAWQITPRILIEAIANPDRAAAKRVMAAMMAMRRIDIAKIQTALTQQATN